MSLTIKKVSKTEAKSLNPRRFTSYKVYPHSGMRNGFVTNLTLEEVRDESRFPLGPQTDHHGRLFVWSYGINDGIKI